MHPFFEQSIQVDAFSRRVQHDGATIQSKAVGSLPH